MADSLIGSLRVALSLGTADFEAGANKAASIAKSKGKEIEGAFSGAKAAITGLFAAFSIGVLADQIKKSLDYAGSIAEVARQLNVTTTQLQTLRFAATQTGVAQDQLEVGLRRLTVSMGKAELGGKAQAKAFGAIGISVDQLKGKNTGEVFSLMADGLSKVTDHSQRAAIEMTLMGRSGSQLDNLLAPGSARLNELANAAKTLGIVLSDSQIQNAEQTAHKLSAIKEVLSAQIAGVVSNNASAILGLSSALATLLGQVLKLAANPIALAVLGAAIGYRFGGLPGLAVGGVGGALLGIKAEQSADDSNNDVKFRAQQLLAARQAYYSASSAGGPAMSVAGIQTGGGAPDTAGLLAEYRRQAGLYQTAKAASKAKPTSTPTGAQPGQIFAGGGGRQRKAPTDRSDDVEFQFAQQQRELDAQILDAKKSLSHDVGQQAEIGLQILALQAASKDAEIDHKVAQAQRDFADGRITKSALDQVTTEAAIEKGKQDQLTALQRKALLDQRDQALLQQSIELDSYGYDIKKAELQKVADLAQTQEERRAAELELLDLTYKEKKIMLDRIVAESNDPAAIDKANQDLLALSTNYQLDRAGVLKSTQGPLQQYLDSLPTTSKKWTEALQGVAVDGFGQISNQADVLAGKLIKVGGVFGDVTRTILADILKIELQKLFIAPIVNALGSLFGGSGVGSSNIGALAPVGINLGNTSLVPSGGLPGLAGGGSGIIGGNMGTDRNTLSLNGTPIARVGYGETLSVDPNGGGGGLTVIQNFSNNFAGGAATQDDVLRMGIAAKQGAIEAVRESNRRRS